jgi:hypothetical protein
MQNGTGTGDERASMIRSRNDHGLSVADRIERKPSSTEPWRGASTTHASRQATPIECVSCSP